MRYAVLMGPPHQAGSENREDPKRKTIYHIDKDKDNNSPQAAGQRIIEEGRRRKKKRLRKVKHCVPSLAATPGLALSVTGTSGSILRIKN